jgi:hypothetical protein
MVGDTAFMSVWVVVVFALATGASQTYDHQRSMTA